MINKKYNNTLNDDIQSNNSSKWKVKTFNTLSKIANFGNDKSNNKNENIFRILWIF